MKTNLQSTEEDNVDLTKYNKVYVRHNNQWVMNGYECKTCLSRLKRMGRLVIHHETCKGRPLNPSQRGDY